MRMAGLTPMDLESRNIPLLQSLASGADIPRHFPGLTPAEQGHLQNAAKTYLGYAQRAWERGSRGPTPTAQPGTPVKYTPGSNPASKADLAVWGLPPALPDPDAPAHAQPDRDQTQVIEMPRQPDDAHHLGDTATADTVFIPRVYVPAGSEAAMADTAIMPALGPDPDATAFIPVQRPGVDPAATTVLYMQPLLRNA